MVASSLSRSDLLVCFALVFCASFCTKIFPLNTPLERSRRTYLYSSWLGQLGFSWCSSVLLSQCCSPLRIASPLSVAYAPSPSSTQTRSLRVSRPPSVALCETKFVPRPTRIWVLETWYASTVSCWSLQWSTFAPSPARISVTALVKYAPCPAPTQ